MELTEALGIVNGGMRKEVYEESLSLSVVTPKFEDTAEVVVPAPTCSNPDEGLNPSDADCQMASNDLSFDTTVAVPRVVSTLDGSVPTTLVSSSCVFVYADGDAGEMVTLADCISTRTIYTPESATLVYPRPANKKLTTNNKYGDEVK